MIEPARIHGPFDHRSTRGRLRPGDETVRERGIARTNGRAFLSEDGQSASESNAENEGMPPKPDLRR